MERGLGQRMEELKGKPSMTKITPDTEVKLKKHEESRESCKEIFKYNTKNAGQQLLTLSNECYMNLDEVSKTDILEAMNQIGIYMLKQYEKHKDKFE